ncbi:hypothetical protein SteCoe_36264 [Stentor coeruleus]|uniref:Uncharacterized protein n=1 Tax=Stentor coeruleus TaxID=5963 RepID=A0A1R2AQI9_9CILI|nr:hypothetical protein SteCoe_36264 [Stentor coeruleus]
MGSCTSKVPTKEQEKKIELPNFYYLSRSTCTLIHCHDNRMESLGFKGSFKIYKDSIIGLIGSNFIFSLCGTKLNGKITSRAYAINTKTCSLYTLKKLPEKIENGSIFYYKSVVFIINSGSFGLISYDFTDKDWETLTINFEKSKYRKFSKFSCFLQGNKVYSICGIYKKRPNVDIFTLNLDDFTFTKSSMQVPLYLINPICISRNDNIIITGGLEEDGTANTKIYIKNLNNDWEVLAGPKSIKLEDYPPILNDTSMIFFAFPKMLVKFKNNFVVYNLSMTDNANFPTQDKKKKSIVSVNSISSQQSMLLLQAEILDQVIVENHYTSSSSDSDFINSQSLPSEDEAQKVVMKNRISDDVYDTHKKVKVFGLLKKVDTEAIRKNKEDLKLRFQANQTAFKSKSKAPFLPSNFLKIAKVKIHETSESENGEDKNIRDSFSSSFEELKIKPISSLKLEEDKKSDSSCEIKKKKSSHYKAESNSKKSSLSETKMDLETEINIPIKKDANSDYEEAPQSTKKECISQSLSSPSSFIPSKSSKYRENVSEDSQNSINQKHPNNEIASLNIEKNIKYEFSSSEENEDLDEKSPLQTTVKNLWN